MIIELHMQKVGLEKSCRMSVFTVSVYASSPDGSVVVSSTEMIDIERPSQPLKASCPPVAEPNIPYRCGFASIPGSGNLTVKYDGTDAYQIHPFSVEKLSFGNMPPRKEDFQNQELIMELPGAILEPTVLANGKASSYTKIVFVEWYGGVLGSPIELYVKYLLLALFEQFYNSLIFIDFRTKLFTGSWR